MIADCGLRIADWPDRLQSAICNLQSTIGVWAPLALVALLGIALRLVPWLAGYPLHRDEALYGFWARLIASGQDPLLLTAWVDKPPLVIYLLAASLRLFGVSELVLRLPGMIAGVLLIPATYALARRVYDPRTATLAALLVAASPFAILFAPTAFTDPWLTLWLVIAAWAAVSDRPFWAGLTLGLAVASKQQGLLGVPLIVGLLMLNDRQTANCKLQTRRRLFAICNLLFAALLGFALILVPLTYWDSLRWHNRPSFWDRSLTTYGGIAFAPLAEWPQRAVAWAGQLGYLWGAPVLSAVMLGLALWAGIWGKRWLRAQCRAKNEKGKAPGDEISAHTTGYAVSVLICVFVVGYLALHFALTFQAWDRYLLPLAPLVSVLAACGLTLAWGGRGVTAPADENSRGGSHAAGASGVGARPAILRTIFHAAGDATADEKRPPGLEALAGLLVGGSNRLKPLVRSRRTFFRADAHAARGTTADENSGGGSHAAGASGMGARPAILRTAFALTLASLLGSAGWLGAMARVPVGSDHGAYAGLEHVVAVIRTRPADAIVYHHSLGWHFDFYLFDAPQERRWYDAPAKLVADAGRTVETEPDREQWLAVPDWESDTIGEIETALAERELALTEIERIYWPDGSRSFVLYRILQSEATHGD
ncbi:MAG: glycosyltransferase family 39 protein [Chloroflexi bacterium]|nr:glycosyltransferase family 39 protein [Chloroflexota bacterium]